MACQAIIQSKKSQRCGQFCGRYNCTYHPRPIDTTKLDECSVCFDTPTRPATCLECDKMICGACAKIWFKQSNEIKCPNCRSIKGFMNDCGRKIGMSFHPPPPDPLRSIMMTLSGDIDDQGAEALFLQHLSSIMTTPGTSFEERGEISNLISAISSGHMVIRRG